MNSNAENWKGMVRSMAQEKYVAYVGTYTHENSVGIHIYDVDVENGSMKERKVVPINNPSDLVVSKNKKFLYSIADEGVEAFKILKDGDLEQAVTRIIAQLEERDRIRQKEEEETPVFRFNADRKAKNKYVEQAIKHIREHYKEDINISTVAEQLQISEGYLSRVFKKETDYTFTTYLSHYRMKVAMELLKEGKLKVYEVADSVGYSDTAYFSAQFKKVVGIAPSEYQERIRGY